MKIFTCDKCLTQFKEPLDEVLYVDIHGNSYVFDLCAPCRKDLKEKDKKVKTDFFEEIKK